MADEFKAIDDFQPLDQAFIDGMRRRIDVARIIDRMNKHAIDPGTYPMTISQLKAATVLLKKIMPDLQATQISADQGFAAAFAAAVKAASGVGSDPI